MSNRIRVTGNPDSPQYDFELRLSSRDNVTVPQYLREKHLTPDVESAKVQAIGRELQVVLESDRDSISLRIPFESGERRFSGVKSRSLNRNGVAVGTWSQYLSRVDDGGIPARVVVLDG